MSTFAVEFVEPDDLPPGHDWAMVYSGTTSDQYVFFIKDDAVTADALTDAWAAYRRLARSVEEASWPPPPASSWRGALPMLA